MDLISLNIFGFYVFSAMYCIRLITYKVFISKKTFFRIQHHAFTYIAIVSQYIHISKSIDILGFFINVPDERFFIRDQFIYVFIKVLYYGFVIIDMRYSRSSGYIYVFLYNRNTRTDSGILKYLSSIQIYKLVHVILANDKLAQFLCIYLIRQRIWDNHRENSII